MQQHKAVLTHRGLAISEATLQALYGQQGYKKLLSRCTLHYKPRVGQPVTRKLYELAARKTASGTLQNFYWLPRGLVRELRALGVTVSVSLPEFAPCAECEFRCGLFPNQEVVVKRLLQEFTLANIQDGTATTMLNLQAGMGKTFVAGALIHALCVNTVYVVPTVYLADQAVKDLKGCFDDTVEITKFERKAKKETPCKPNVLNVVVVVINTALLEPPTFFDNFGLTVLDEVHTYCADKRAAIFQRNTRCVLGMSATTDQRRDTFDAVATYSLCDVPCDKNTALRTIIHANTLPGFEEDRVQFDCTVRVIKYKGPSSHTQCLKHPSTDKMFTPWMNKQFLADKQRTQIMCAELRKLYDWVGPNGQQHRIFVFCEEREPLAELYSLLAELFEVDAPELAGQVGTFISGVKATEVARAKVSARVILTTYGYSSTGISINEMTALVLWTPRRSNMLQIAARILRRGGDFSIPRVVVDLVDWNSAMKSQYYERRNAYAYYDMKDEIITHTALETGEPAFTIA